MILRSKKTLKMNTAADNINLENTNLDKTAETDMSAEKTQTGDPPEKSNVSDGQNPNSLGDPSQSSKTDKECQSISLSECISQNLSISKNEKIGDNLSKSNDLDVVQFSPEAEMKWSSWVLYFESVCLENNKNNVWKIRNIQKFLKGRALTTYINNCLHILHWEELLDIFNEAFHTPCEPSLGDFSEIKFSYGGDLNQYYQRKLQVGRALGLESKLILEGLTDGLPIELRQLVITNAPKTTNEWRELVFKLNKLPRNEKSDISNYRKPENSNVNYFRQWRPSRPFNPNYVPQPRFQQWQYRSPNVPNNNRMYQPNNFRSTRPPINNTVRHNMHYQESISPAPCRICKNMGIHNAYHWARNCPFNRQNRNVDPRISFNQNSEVPESSLPQPNVNNAQAGNDVNEGDGCYVCV